MQSITTPDGTDIAYERAGDGPPLVLVHGSAGDHTGWREVLPGLADSFTVYAIDRRGRGESGDADDYEIEREYADVAAVVEHVAAEHGDEPVSLLGHSYGAICSLHAILETDAVDRLVLYEPPLADAPAAEGMAEDLEETIESEGPEAALVTFLTEAVEVGDEEIELMRQDDRWENRVASMPTLPREIRATQRGLFDPDRFNGVDLPATLLVGGESPERMKEATDRVAAALDGSRVVELDGEEHIATTTAPDRFVEVVTDALG